MFNKHVDETQLYFNYDCEQSFGLALSAIEKGGFSNISSNKSSLTISANYHKLTVWGKIEIVFKDAPNGSYATIGISSKKDNVYALAQDPSEKILLAFKNQLPSDFSSSKSPDIPDQIKKISEMKDSGILTLEEFELKKAELLARM